MNNEIINSFEMGIISDSECLRIGKRKKQESASHSKIYFGQEEHIVELEFDYNDKAILGIRLSTTEQIISLGPIEESELHTKFERPDPTTAIIGFHMVYGSDRIVEISIFIAPLNKKELSVRESGQIHLDRLLTHANQRSIKQQDFDRDELKETFKLYRKLKKNQSF